MHEAKTKLWRSIQHFDPNRAQFSTWFERVLHNRFIELFLRNRPRPVASLDVVDECMPPCQAAVLTIPGEVHDADYLKAVRRRLAELVEKEIVKPEEADAFAMWYFGSQTEETMAAGGASRGEMTYKEIGERIRDRHGYGSEGVGPQDREKGGKVDLLLNEMSWASMGELTASEQVVG